MKPQFEAEFTKSYNRNGKQFTIQTQYRGVSSDGVDEGEPKDIWRYQLLVDDQIVRAGPFRWKISERNLSSENVANHLASWFEHMDLEQLKEDAKSVLITGTPNEKAQFIVWMEFYENHLPEVKLGQVEVLSSSVIGDDWFAIVRVDGKFEKTMYHLSYETNTSQMHIQVFDWIRSHRISI